MKLFLSLLILITIATAKDKLETSKTSCIQQSLYPNKTLDQQKKILIEKAKQESLEELYGTLISSSIDIENGKMKRDQIRSRAVGAVRVSGNPSFYNGKNLGEICTDVKVYITQKDLEKYSPKKVSLTHYCFNDPSVAMKDIKKEAKYGAYKEIISQYKPSMKITGKEAEKFIHGFTISNDQFDFDTASYCFNAVGTILPYELEMDPKKTTTSSINATSNSSNLNDTIYGKWYGSYYWGNANDFLMMNIEIKKDNTFKAIWNKADQIKNTYYTGVVMKNKNKIMLLPDQKHPTGAPNGWTTDSLSLIFDKKNLVLEGKITNYSSKSAARFVKVEKFPLEYTVQNPDNDINGKWYGWYRCSNYYYLTMDISDGEATVKINNGKHIATADPYKYTIFKTKNKVFFDGEKVKIHYTKLGNSHNDWTIDDLHGVIDGNKVTGNSSCGSDRNFFLTKVSKFPPTNF